MTARTVRADGCPFGQRNYSEGADRRRGFKATEIVVLLGLLWNYTFHACLDILYHVSFFLSFFFFFFFGNELVVHSKLERVRIPKIRTLIIRWYKYCWTLHFK